MQQRGRKSSATIVALDFSSSRLTAPPTLNKAERALFNEIVLTTDPRHFVRSDLPLLISYVQATLLSRRTVAKLGTNPTLINVWEKATRVAAMLATRLRLAPQARTSHATAARHASATPLSYYDRMDDDD
jgi:hypothetical protein